MAQGRIAVMGAGAVGCFYGARLAQAGADVVLIGRPALADAVAAQGLLLEMGGERIAVPLAASADPAAVAGADLVLFCVKSGDTEAAGRQIAPHLAPGAQVLSLQNGVGNAERLAAVTGGPVLPAVVYVAAQMGGPGHVIHRGRGDLVLGDGPGAEAVAARLRAAGIEAAVSAQTVAAQWEKLVINCALNAVSALTAAPYGRIVAQPGALDLMQGVVAECQAVAAASGVALPGGIWDQVLRIAEVMPTQISSTAQDMQRGRATEIDYLNGEIARRGQALGLPVPLNAALTALVRLKEQG